MNFRTVVIAARRAVVVALASFILAGSASAQLPWLAPEDGDLFNVSRADGIERGRFLARLRHSAEQLPDSSDVVMTRFLLEYGLGEHVNVGLSVPHLAQKNGLLHKEGLGDTNLSLKVHLQPYPDLPFRVGLRQSLSLPTGYENERHGLRSFTSREYDYSAQALFQYDGERGGRSVSVVANPGVLLPGGELDSYVTGGFGLALDGILPLGFEGFGEYYTRWNLVSHEFDASIAFGAGREVAFGLGIEAGARRRLLQEEAEAPELHLGVSWGWPKHQADEFEVELPRRPRAALLVLPLESMVPDPRGVMNSITTQFRNEASHGAPPLAVYVRTIPGEHVEALARNRHYELLVRILSIEEGTVEALSVPLLLRAPRASAKLTAQMELIAPDGFTVAARSVIQGSAKRSIGAELVPTSTSLASLVVPDEIKNELREKAAADLATQILRAALAAIDSRDQEAE